MKRSFQSCLLCLVFSATISLLGCGGDDGNTNTGGDDLFVGADADTDADADADTDADADADADTDADTDADAKDADLAPFREEAKQFIGFIMQRIDTNSDGVIDSEEIAASDDPDRMKEADANEDGEITKDEMIESMAKAMKDRQDRENGEEGNTEPMEDNSTDSGELADPAAGITKDAFGETADGEAVDIYTLTNKNGLVVKMITYGAIVVSVETPDRDGNLGNINVGFDSMDGYLGGPPYFGATVGRFCNRIANAKFSLDGEEYTLAANNDPNHLHGGEQGFDKQLWDAEPLNGDDFVGIKFSRVSADGEEGYPGNLTTTAIYKLTDNNELVVDLSATTDKKTVVNLTNHNYWNLGGVGSGLVHEHLLKVEADEYLPMDDTGIPTGEIATVTDTTLDFIEFHKIGERLADNMTDPVGYDHCYALRDREKASVDNLVLAATLKHEGTGRVMEIYTSQIGLQFYTGNYLDGTEANAGLAQYSALCLETQHYPDSPNQDQFPTTVLNPGESYHHVTVHRFSAE